MNTALIISLNPSLIRPFILKWGISLKTISVFCLALLVFLIGFYIFQINEITKAGFAVSTYEKQISELARESKNLELSVSDVGSLSSLETVLASLGYQYEQIGKVHYIQMMENMAVAK